MDGLVSLVDLGAGDMSTLSKTCPRRPSLSAHLTLGSARGRGHLPRLRVQPLSA